MKSVFALIVLLVSQSSFAAVPTCLDDEGKVLGNSNTQVLNWLHSTAKGFQAKALVEGVLVKQYKGKATHAHFAIDMNGDQKGDLEVIYQYDAGKLPALQVGMKVSACGDYITDPKGSPNGGIIHWVHCRSRAGTHSDGYVTLNGKVYGFDPQNGETCVNPL